MTELFLTVSGELTKLTSNRTWLGFRQWKTRWVIVDRVLIVFSALIVYTNRPCFVKIPFHTTRTIWPGQRHLFICRLQTAGYKLIFSVGQEKGTIPLSVVQFAANNPETKTWGFTVCADHEDPQL